MQESETLENADRHETGGIESSPLLSPVFLCVLGVLCVTFPKVSGRKESSSGMVKWIPACTDKRKRKNARMTQTQKSALLHRFYLSRYRHFLKSASIRVHLWLFSPVSSSVLLRVSAPQREMFPPLSATVSATCSYAASICGSSGSSARMRSAKRCCAA